jgi:hypothetical protein
MEALGRQPTNSTRDKDRLRTRAEEFEAIAAAMGAKIEVRF